MKNTGEIKNMIYVRQQTLREKGALEGIGLHSGRYITMDIYPAKADHGIVFVRTDLPAGKNKIPARWDYVTDTTMCTVISNEYGANVGTIEHLMSALRGCGVDNARIELDGSEVPAMDGSALPFVEMIDRAGVVAQDAPRRMIRVLKEVQIQKNGKIVTLKPDRMSVFEGEIDFDHEIIGKQHFTTQLVNGNFRHDIAGARTFGFYHEAQWLRSQGLALGGSLENAIILDDDGIMNSEGLRFSDEFIRHKLLDAIGDLYLAEHQILGRYSGAKAGHDVNNAILRKLFSDDENWEYVTLGCDSIYTNQSIQEKQMAYA